MPRTLAITKKVTLEGLADGWTNEAYAIVKPATYAEFQELAGITDQGKSNIELVQYQLDVTKKHFIGGKVFVLDGNNVTVLDDMTLEDIDESKDLADRLFKEIVGVTLDPKDIATVTEKSPTSDHLITP